MGQLTQSLKNAEDVVFQVLKENEKARDDYSTLLFGVWEKQGLKLTDMQKAFVARCMSPETASRCRRKIQERGFFRGKFYGSSQQTFLEEEYRNHFKKT